MGFSSEQALGDFLHSRQEMEVGVATVLAEAASAAGAEDLLCEVEAQLFLVAPSAERKETTITTVTAVNFSSCHALWRESAVFEFGSAFKHHLSSPIPATSTGELSQSILALISVPNYVNSPSLPPSLPLSLPPSLPPPPSPPPPSCRALPSLSDRRGTCCLVWRRRSTASSTGMKRSPS